MHDWSIECALKDDSDVGAMFRGEWEHPELRTNRIWYLIVKRIYNHMKAHMKGLSPDEIEELRNN